MRYADGPTVDAEVLVDASADRVWELISDIELPARFSSELQSAHWLDASAPAAGARFVGRNAHPAAGEWQTTSVVTAVIQSEPPPTSTPSPMVRPANAETSKAVSDA